MSRRHVVAAGYVTVETAVPGGRAQIDIPRGAALPDDVPAEQVAQLAALGHIGPAGEVSAERVDDGDQPPPPGSPPPRGGVGSGVEVWVAYAHTHNVVVPEGYTRDQVQALLVEHGVPVE